MEHLRNRGLGVITLALYLLFIGAVGLLGLALPGWIGFVLAILAGIFLLVGI